MEYKLPFVAYNEALKKNKLLGLKCSDCGTVTCPPMMVCSQCAGTNHDVYELSGMGEIVTFSTSYVAAEGRECELPYTIVLVELDEGPWIMGNLIEMDPRKVTMEVMGKRVIMGFKIFPGDKYSAGNAARPVFSFA